MKKIILALLIGLSFFSCKKGIIKKETEYYVITDTPGFTVTYIDMKGDTLYEHIDGNMFAKYYEAPRGQEVYLKAKSDNSYSTIETKIFFKREPFMLDEKSGKYIESEIFGKLKDIVK